MDLGITLPNKLAVISDFNIGDSVWYFSFGSYNYVFPAIVKAKEETYIIVWKYCLGLWVERYALPTHLSKRNYDISFDIYTRRMELFK